MRNGYGGGTVARDGHAAEKRIVVALAGNLNVGKSVIFNQLTGLHQHVGNWPGKTVAKAEGTLHFGAYTIDVVDLPGIYSLSSYSLEERITMEYIVNEKPDVVINVVDASHLERNLYFTIQLLETGAPLIVALNQIDQALKSGITPDEIRMEKELGVPVISTVAVRGTGLHELMRTAIDIAEHRVKRSEVQLAYGKEVEPRVQEIARALSGRSIHTPIRYAALRLLEGGEEVEQLADRAGEEAVLLARKHREELEQTHGHDIGTVVVSERYELARRIARDSQMLLPQNSRRSGKLDELTSSGLSGYLIMLAVVLAIFATIFGVGDTVAPVLEGLLSGLRPIVLGLLGRGAIGTLTWGALESLIAGATIALPYIVPFYLIMGIMEDSGYLARMASMMDNVMHVVGLHGKAFIPLILGYGCNVPACLGCRIMETARERTLAIFLTTLVPCAGRTVIILGLVGRYVGIEWALAIYGLNLVVIVALGRLAYKTLPREPSGLIMEIPSYHLPHLSTALKRTWFETKSFALVAMPLMVAGGVVLKSLETWGLLSPIGDVLNPVTVGLLGLPPMAGVVLIFGVLRKELSLAMLAALEGTTDFAAILTHGQMIVFSVVTMFYIPCLGTIAAVRKELGWTKALIIVLSEIALAIILGGVANRLLI